MSDINIFLAELKNLIFQITFIRTFNSLGKKYMLRLGLAPFCSKTKTKLENYPSQRVFRSLILFCMSLCTHKTIL